MIDPDAFIQRLNRTKTLSQKLSTALMSGLKINKYEANETFVSPGNFATAIYFIQTGLVRGAIEGPKEKNTTWFKQDGDLIVPQGLFNQQPSEEYISVIVNTTLLAIPLTHIQNVLESNPELIELIIFLIAESKKESHYREKLLRMPTAKDRYKFLIKNEDYILKRIPQYFIASYINVSKETFSRLHKRRSY